MLIILILMAVLSLIATDIFVPSLPAIAAYFGQSTNHAELTVSLFLVGFAFSQLFYGPISDRVGRKPPIIFGLGLFVLGSILCILAPSFELFCLGRILEGLAVGGGLSLTRVVLRDLFSGVTLAVKSSQMAIFICLAPAIAPFVGGLLQNEFGFRSVFVFLSVYGLFLLALVIFCFKEPLKHKEKSLSLSRTLKHYRELISNFHFMHYVLITGFGFSAIILYANILPFIIQQQLHLSATVNGEVLLFAASGLTISALISSRIVKRVSPRTLLYLGLSLLLTSGLLLIMTEALQGTHLFFLAPCIFLVTLACGFIFPNALALSFASINVNIGIAGAIYGFTQTFISTLVNFLLNVIPDQGQMLLGIFYVVLSVIGLLLLMVPVKNTIPT
ncbi:MAG: multidrug effflux MFS transporter [Gammaproteobacteria bacterium]|nr:multidrug effflux MFS transporter [Gammaproteobacteria bacterium]